MPDISEQGIKTLVSGVRSAHRNLLAGKLIDYRCFVHSDLYPGRRYKLGAPYVFDLLVIRTIVCALHIPGLYDLVSIEWAGMGVTSLGAEFETLMGQSCAGRSDSKWCRPYISGKEVQEMVVLAL